MHFTIRLAKPNDFKKLVEFYKREQSTRLPAPTLRDLAEAVENRQLLMAVDDDGVIAATAGTFEITPATARDFVAELAGTRVTKVLGGTRPIKVQSVLIVLRMLLFVGTAEHLNRNTTDCLIVSIRKDNLASRTNILDCGFAELNDRPDWLRYHETSWIGQISLHEWDHFHATTDTAMRCVELYFSSGMDRGVLELQSTDAILRLMIDLPGLRYLHDDLWAIGGGQRRVRLAGPPVELILSD